MKLLKKALLGIIILICSAAGFAQQVSFNDPFILDFVIRAWKGDDGLSGNSITDVIQTKDGYIYLGTYDGLARFDGAEFLTFNKNTDSAFNFVSARTLFQDSKGNFWVGANDEGVTCIKPDRTTLEFNTENGLPNNSVRSFCEDKNGVIWIGTSSGIVWIKDDKIQQIDESLLPNNNHILVKSLYMDTAGRVWVVTADGNGVLVYSEGSFSKYKGLKKASSNQITSVTQDSSQVFWFGIAPHYVVRYDGQEETLFDVGFSSQKGTTVNCIEEDYRGNMWCGLDTGITVIHDGKLSYLNAENGLSDEKVVKIQEDREHNLWIATDRGGIVKLSRTKFKTTSLTTSINAIAKDTGRNVVWLAADNGLMCIKDGERIENRITEYCRNVRIRHVEYTATGKLLISTYEKLGQIMVSADGTITSWTKEKDGLTGNKVRVAIEASDKKLYIGTTTGLNIVEPRSGKIKTVTKKDGLENDYIMCLYEAKDGTIWCGTDGGGVFLYKDGSIVKMYSTLDGLSGNVIFKINSFNGQDMWITTGTGINLLRNGKFTIFNASNGLGTNSVFQVILDYTEKVWCTSNKGIFCVPLSDFYDVADGKKPNVLAKYYGRSDGILSGGVTSTSCSIRDDEGCLWFTLIDGYTRFDPVRNSVNSLAPITHVQQVSVDNEKAVLDGSTIYIPSSGKRLSIKYTGLSFMAPEQVQFKYKLDGFDNDYSEWSYSRNVSYTNLKPGTYRFTVYSRDGNEIVSAPSNVITFVKKAALWQMPWFWIVLIVCIAALVLFIIRNRINHLQEDNERLQQIYMEITRALTGTIDAKDKYTNGHSERVAKYSVMIGRRAGLSEEKLQNIYMMAILHDIGKIGIPDNIINKPGKLTEEEFQVIKTHPVIGSDILRTITSLKGIYIGARSHHEKYNGTGYPDGLKGEEIPLEARIIGVADAYDAMTSNRSYRNFLPQEFVREQIEKGKGSQFDPALADIMLSIIKEDTNYSLHG